MIFELFGLLVVFSTSISRLVVELKDHDNVDSQMIQDLADVVKRFEKETACVGVKVIPVQLLEFSYNSVI